MRSAGLLTDAFGRVASTVDQAVDGLSPDQLADRLDGRANSIAWLVWHLTRIEDDHIAHVAGTEQVWTADRWYARFALPFDARATGYGHRPDEVAACTVRSAELLTGYHHAAHDAAVRFVDHVTDADLDRIVDESWDPPVTLGVRLVSVIADGLQHAGQAAFVRGIVDAR